ncbi:TPA: 50S ribosomal protein L10 [Patescibacteria group bacterium]|nr:50S ribosomal protein L10 [Candidatus Gracilibacteria bacterium]
MAITKDKKKELLKQYVESLKNAGSTYVIKQNAIPVDVSTKVRKEMKLADAKFNVVRKRIFLKAVEEAGLEKIDLALLQ